jgi:hypothetical protein
MKWKEVLLLGISKGPYLLVRYGKALPNLWASHVSGLSYWKNISKEAIEKFVSPMFTKIAQNCSQNFYVNYVKFGNFFEYFLISNGHYLLTSPLWGGDLPS